MKQRPERVRQGPGLRCLPQQDRSRAVVDAIRQATIEIVRRDGVAALKTNVVAELAGVGVASLYRYFPNKESILLDIYRNYEQVLVENARCGESFRELGLAERIELGMTAQLAATRELVATCEDLRRRLGGAILSPPGLELESLGYWRLALSDLDLAFDASGASGDAEPALELAALAQGFLPAMLACGSAYASAPPPGAPDPLVSRLVAMSLSLLGAYAPV